MTNSGAISSSALELRPLRREDKRSFLEAVEEFRRETPPWDFALGSGEAADFADYVRRLEGWSRGEHLPSGYVPGAFYVGVVDGEVVGRLSLRYRLNDFLRTIGGHIGYGVRPSRRRRGCATEMLRQSLPLCAALGLTRALLTCDADNIASRKVIERCGGVFEGFTSSPELDVQKRRYWIETAPVKSPGSASMPSEGKR